MTEFVLTIKPTDLKVPVRAGQLLLDALAEAGVTIRADCGGHGLCKHCAVTVLSGEVLLRDPAQFAETPDGQNRVVLACQVELCSDASILLPLQGLTGELVAEGSLTGTCARHHEADSCSYLPLVRRLTVSLATPNADDSAADWQRLQRRLTEAAPDLVPLGVGLKVLQTLPGTLRRDHFTVEATVADRGAFHEVIDLAPSHVETPPPLGLAVDIGTSTVVAQVVDLHSGRLLGQAAGTNAQKRYGADVIARIMWAEEHCDGPAQMQTLITSQITELARQACRTSSCNARDLIAVSIAANTTMSTFAVGAHPGPIRRTPHVPVTRELPTFHAADLELGVHPLAPVFFSPSVSGFVGGDITAGVVATGMACSSELSLLVDVGTNGEIVLGNRDWLICCSCSAGPAFEGIDIAAGTHAVPGAIDRFHYDPAARRFRWQTIGNARPHGLCGTGLLEALAALFRGGFLDRTGHLVAQPGGWCTRPGHDEMEALLVPAAESATGEDLVLRESEIENLIRAKGAIYAGISCLLNAVDHRAEDLDRIYVSGSFGSRLRVEETVSIGMLPDVPRDRITFAGNTSLTGAYQALLSRAARDEMAAIAQRMTYLELSNLPNFMDEFVAALFLPHTELHCFPSQKMPVLASH